MAQEFTPQTEMLNRLSQIPLQQPSNSMGITVLHSSLREIPISLSLQRAMLSICNKNLNPNQARQTWGIHKDLENKENIVREQSNLSKLLH